MTTADTITSVSDKIILPTLNCGGAISYPGTGSVEISFPVKSRPKIFDDIGHNSGGLTTTVLPTTKLAATDLANKEIG